MRKNILITSAGRRVELVQAFLEQSKLLSPDSKVIALDVRPEMSSACHVADYHFQSPRADDESYSNFIADFCKSYEIGVVVPTIDTELLPLSSLRAHLEASGTSIVISGKGFVEKCRDKRRTGELFEEIEIRYPNLFTKHNAACPIFVKPFDGSSSVGARWIGSADELQTVDSNYMFMEYIGKPFVEYTVDCYFDRFGVPRCVVPRLRIETRAGEVSKGVTEKGAVHDKVWAFLDRWKEARGCITVQVFFNPTTEEVVGLEINPRFGGGFPLTYAAGANYVGWIIKEYVLVEMIESFLNWEDKLLMLRYDAKVLVHATP